MRDINDIPMKFIGTRYDRGVRVDEYVPDYTPEERDAKIREIVRNLHEYFSRAEENNK